MKRVCQQSPKGRSKNGGAAWRGNGEARRERCNPPSPVHPGGVGGVVPQHPGEVAEPGLLVLVVVPPVLPVALHPPVRPVGGNHGGAPLGLPVVGKLVAEGVEAPGGMVRQPAASLPPGFVLFLPRPVPELPDGVAAHPAGGLFPLTVEDTR
mgnify:CR=1 FL=1